METLLDSVAVFAACADLSIDVVMGEMYPTVTLRQGPGLSLCATSLKGIAPYLAVMVVGLGTLSMASRARRRRRAKLLKLSGQRFR